MLGPNREVEAGFRPASTYTVMESSISMSDFCIRLECMVDLMVSRIAFPPNT